MLIFVKNHKLRKEINVSMQGRVLLLQKVVIARAESARRPPGCNGLLKKECRLSDRAESLELENPALPLSCFRAKRTHHFIRALRIVTTCASANINTFTNSDTECTLYTSLKTLVR